jgi:hypothetical protein
VSARDAPCRSSVGRDDLDPKPSKPPCNAALVIYHLLTPCWASFITKRVGTLHDSTSELRLLNTSYAGPRLLKNRVSHAVILRRTVSQVAANRRGSCYSPSVGPRGALTEGPADSRMNDTPDHLAIILVVSSRAASSEATGRLASERSSGVE